MKQSLKRYFRLFGNPDYPEEGYWEQDPNLFQVLFGILVAPLVIVVLVVVKVLSIKIRL